MNFNADIGAGELMEVLQPMKIDFLNEKGGLFHRVSWKKIVVINSDEVSFYVSFFVFVFHRLNDNADKFRNTTSR